MAVARTTNGIYKVNQENLGKLVVTFPRSIDEQYRIVNLLAKADTIRRKRREALALTDELVRSTFLEMFGDPVSNSLDWPIHPLRKLIVGEPQNGMYRPAEDYGQGTLIVRIDAFDRGRGIDWSSLKRLGANAGEIERYALKEGDVVINRVNTCELVGKAAVVENLPAEAVVFESNMMRVRPKLLDIGAEYLVQELNGARVIQQITRSVKKAVNQASINQGDVMNFSVRVPPWALQEQFLRAITKIREQTYHTRQCLNASEEMFSSLQQRAFKGEL